MPTKLIQAYRNGTYGPPLVTQKYAPLEEIDFAETDAEFCDTLLTRRWRVISDLRLLPARLTLVTRDWAAVLGGERDKRPPLVVISTNRSAWIKKGIEAGDYQLGTLKLKQFDNASDLRALTALTGQKVSPPMYAPLRIGDDNGPRKVYVVVHAAEYEVYKRNLAGTGITVVGWQFRQPVRGALPICGFGASRYAAIEFCKNLRTAAGDPWDYAWLFDDNVVAFTSFAGYRAVEDAMDAADETLICAGFTGGTKAEPAIENKKWAADEIAAGKREGNTRGGQSEALPANKAPGLVQQAALWNIAELTRRRLNFGPIFITSGEDVSLAAYFDHKKIPYLFYEGIKVLKEEPENDGGPGAAAIQKSREQIADLIAQSEWVETDRDPALPPPIMFKPHVKTDDTAVRDRGEQTLGRFVVATVLPNASAEIQLKARDIKTKNTAMCQSAEQSICKAIKLGLMRDPALDQTFKINGDNLQAVERFSMG